MRALEPLPRLIRIPAITSLRIVSALYWSILHTSAGLYCSGSMLMALNTLRYCLQDVAQTVEDGDHLPDTRIVAHLL
jgi:hypothetical protein